MARRGGRSPGPRPVAGVALVLAACLGLSLRHRLPGGLVLGLALLVGATLLATVLGHRLWLTTVLAVPGATVLATLDGVPEIGWIQALVVIAVVGGGALVADFDERWGDQGYGPVLIAVTALGVYAAVPDTERALVMAGAALPLMVCAWRASPASLGRAGSYAATAMIVWVATTDGAGRHSSIVGGVACLGLLLVEPVVRALRRGRSPLEVLDGARQESLRLAGVAAVQAGLVAVAARFAGLRDRLAECLLIVAVELALSVLIGLAVGKERVRPAAG